MENKKKQKKLIVILIILIILLLLGIICFWVGKNVSTTNELELEEKNLENTQTVSDIIINDLENTVTTEQTNELENLESEKSQTEEKKQDTGKVNGNKKPIEESIIIGNITFTLNPDTWTNKDVVVTANTTGKGLKLQTSIDGEKWEEKTSQTVEKNGTIHARLVDGKNKCYASETTKVSLIDKIQPIISKQLTSSINLASNSITLELGTKDETSGIGKIVWYYKVSTENSYNSNVEDTYTELNGKNAGVTSEQIKTKRLTGLSEMTTYKAYAKVYDVAGNSIDTQEVTFTTRGAVASIGIDKYESITKAIEVAKNNDTIVILKNCTENLTIPSNKNVKLNTNGYTITGTINNKGTLNILGGGKITSATTTITNSGVLTSTSTTIDTTSTSIELIINTGKVTINSGTLTSKYTGILNRGTTILKGGTYNMTEWFLLNDASGTIQISGGNYTSKNNNGLINNGKVTISGSTVFNSCKYQTIWNAGTLELRGGTIKSSVSNVISNRAGSNTTMSGGTITSSSSTYPAFYNYGTFNATGGSISASKGYAVYTNGGKTNISDNVSITGTIKI